MTTRFKRQFLLVVSLLTALVLFSAIPHAHAASSGRLPALHVRKLPLYLVFGRTSHAYFIGDKNECGIL